MARATFKNILPCLKPFSGFPSPLVTKSSYHSSPNSMPIPLPTSVATFCAKTTPGRSPLHRPISMTGSAHPRASGTWTASPRSGPSSNHMISGASRPLFLMWLPPATVAYDVFSSLTSSMFSHLSVCLIGIQAHVRWDLLPFYHWIPKAWSRRGREAERWGGKCTRATQRVPPEQRPQPCQLWLLLITQSLEPGLMSFSTP